MKKNKKKKKNNKESRLSLNRKTQRLIVAIILFTLAIILFLGLVNLAGVAGEFFVLGLEILFGWASWFVPIVLVLAGWLILKYEDVKEMNQTSDRRYPSFGARCGGLIFLMVILSAIFHISFVSDKIALIEHYGGGYFGYGLSYLIVNTFGFWASWVIFIGLFIIGLIIVLFGLVSLKKEKQEEGKEKEKMVQQSLFKNIFSKLKSIFKRKQKLVLKPESTDKLLGESIEKEEEEEGEEIIPKIKNIFTKTKSKKDEMPVSSIKLHQKIDLPLNLLGADSTKPNAGDIKENKLIIKKTLENFNILVEMGEIKVGPTVTQYTLKPADGVKLSQITGLHNDLALALAAHPIRIEAPIPGQSLVGIEIPNQQVAVIRLRNILSDIAFKNRKTNLTVALGRDVAGSVG